MTWMGTKSYFDNKRKLDAAASYVEEELSKLFKSVDLSDSLRTRKCFILDDGTVIHVEQMNGEKFCDLVIEYAESVDQMKSYDTEDGDLFPVDGEQDSELLNKLFQEMLKEIAS